MTVIKITVTLYESTADDVVADLERLGYQTGEVEVVEDDDTLGMTPPKF